MIGWEIAADQDSYFSVLWVTLMGDIVQTNPPWTDMLDLSEASFLWMDDAQIFPSMVITTDDY